MIQSFSNPDTEQLFRDEKNRRFNAIARVAVRKLIQLNRARKIEDMAVPPGNRLEALKGNLTGFHSIRINQHEVRQHEMVRPDPEGVTEMGALWAMREQWRIVFRWSEQGPAEVRICDYH